MRIVPGPAQGSPGGQLWARRPRTAHVQETTAVRNGLATLPLADRIGFVVPRRAELSMASFAPLVPAP